MRNFKAREPLAVRFWAKTAINGDCIEWLGSLNGKGYGKIKVERKCLHAHRVSWEMANGPIPDGLCVLHKCDNPKCVNPKHLFLGTQLENLKDMRAKSRSINRGPTVSGDATLLNMDIARAIRADSRSQREIIRAYQISPRQFYNIKSNKTWQQSEHGC